MNPTQLLKHFDRLSEAPDAISRLRRFILDLAVRGKLVEQDPADEPASELIKRIQAEREKLGLTPRHKDAKKSEKAGEEKLGGLAFVPSFRHGLPESSTQGCEIWAVNEKLGLTPRRKAAKKSEKAGEDKLGCLAFVPSFRHGLPESSLQGWKTLRYGNIGYCSARYSLIKISLNPGIALHGNWIPAIPAGMTA